MSAESRSNKEEERKKERKKEGKKERNNERKPSPLRTLDTNASVPSDPTSSLLTISTGLSAGKSTSALSE